MLAIPYFARAMGAAKTGDNAGAEAAIAKLSELQAAAAELPGAYDWAIQVEIQKLAAQAWLAFEQGDQESALALMAEAAKKESSTEKNPVTPERCYRLASSMATCCSPPRITSGH